MDKITEQTTLECRDSVLGLLHETAELLAEKGEKELATTYLEAALNVFCCWEPKYIPKRNPDGNLVWNVDEDIKLSVSHRVDAITAPTLSKNQISEQPNTAE